MRLRENGIQKLKEIMKAHRAHGDWPRYVARFEALMDERNVPAILSRVDFENRVSCLLCSEATPEQCHGRLAAERIAGQWPNVTVVHL